MVFSHKGIPKNALLRTIWGHYKSSERRIETSTNENLIQIPGAYFPHSGYTGGLWVEFQPRKLDQITTGGRGGTYRTTASAPRPSPRRAVSSPTAPGGCWPRTCPATACM